MVHALPAVGHTPVCVVESRLVQLESSQQVPAAMHASLQVLPPFETCVQVPLPSQVSAVQGLPSEVHAVPWGLYVGASDEQKQTPLGGRTAGV